MMKKSNGNGTESPSIPALYGNQQQDQRYTQQPNMMRMQNLGPQGYQQMPSITHPLTSPREDSSTGKDPRSNTPLQRDGRLSASPHPSLHHALSPPPQSLPLPTRSPHTMNQQMSQNGNMVQSRGGTPNLKPGMHNPRAQQNHTPNQMMHISANTDSSLSTPIVSLATPSFPGMPSNFPSALPSGYQGYNELDSGQLQYHSTSLNNNLPTISHHQHQQDINAMQRSHSNSNANKHGVNIKVEPPDHLRVGSPSIHGFSSAGYSSHRHKDLMDQSNQIPGPGPMSKRPRIDGHNDGWQ